MTEDDDDFDGSEWRQEVEAYRETLDIWEDADYYDPNWEVNEAARLNAPYGWVARDYRKDGKPLVLSDWDKSELARFETEGREDLALEYLKELSEDSEPKRKTWDAKDRLAYRAVQQMFSDEFGPT